MTPNVKAWHYGPGGWWICLQERIIADEPFDNSDRNSNRNNLLLKHVVSVSIAWSKTLICVALPDRNWCIIGTAYCRQVCRQVGQQPWHTCTKQKHISQLMFVSDNDTP